MKILKRRYYFWQYIPFKKEWRQLGHMNGYATLASCKKDNYFYMKEEFSIMGEQYPYVILEAKPCLKS